MRIALRIAGLAMGFLLLGITCGMAQSDTATAAKALLERAVAALKSGDRAAIAKFMNRSGGFIEDDLHVFCYDTTNGQFTAHMDYQMLGRDIRIMREKDGTPVGQRVFDAAKPGTIATVDFNSARPDTTPPTPKGAVVTIVDHRGCGVLYYK